MIGKENKRLNSWKEIADYLDRDVRTVSRWEKEKGLPVHRVPGGKRQAIFAYTEEINRWLSSARAKDVNGEGNVSFAERRLPFSPRIAGLAVVFLLVVTFLLIVAGTGYIGPKRSLPPIDTVSLNKGDLVARSKTGEMLWTYSFNERLDQLRQNHNVNHSYVGDIDGDGAQEVLVFVHLAEAVPGQGTDGDKLYCFSAAGKPLWDFEFKDTLTFGGRDYRPPWQLRAFHVYESRGEKRIAFAMSHAVWWPTALIVLDGHGRLRGKFINSGWITTLALLPTASRNFLLAGGFNNARKSGMMAVLDADQVTGASVEEPGSAYECDSCPTGRPLRYFVFPSSELNAFTPNIPHSVGTIRVKEGTIEVHALELIPQNVETIFEFSSDFALQSATFSDGHGAVHRRLEAETKLNHSFEDCPERYGPQTVRAWDSNSGWRELRLPHKQAQSLHQ